MRFLFDQNLSHRLTFLLSDVCSKCVHVRDVNLKIAPDSDVWNYARENDFIIVSKDSDFYQRSLLRGAPPKIIWVKVGNCSTETIDQLLRSNMTQIQRFAEDATATFLVLS